MQPGKPILKTKSSVTLETDSYVSDATSIRQFKQKADKGRSKLDSNWDFIKISMASVFGLSQFTTFLRWTRIEINVNFIHFLIIYVIVGMPMIYLQIAIGYYSQLGVVGLKYLCPIAHSLLFTFLFSLISHAIMCGLRLSSMILYALSCFQPTLQWMVCPDQTQKLCWDVNNRASCIIDCIKYPQIPSAYYFWRHIFMGLKNYQLNNDYISIRVPRTSTISMVVLTWIFVFFVLFISMNSQKRIVETLLILASTSIVIILFVVAFVGGASVKLSEYFYQIEINSFFQISTWCVAIVRCINDFGIGRGIFLMNGVLLTSPSSTGIISIGCVVFMYVISTCIGLICNASVGILFEQARISSSNKIIDDEVRKGPSPVELTTIPQGLGFIAATQLWSVLYFLLCIFLLMNNITMQILLFERSITDNFPYMMKYRKYMLGVLCLFLCVISLLVSSEVTFMARLHFMEISRFFELINALVFTIIVCYLYSVVRFCDDIHFCVGSQPTKFWKFCWWFLPVILSTATIFEANYLYKKCKKCKLRIMTIIFSIVIIAVVFIILLTQLFKHIKQHNIIGMFLPQERWGPSDPEERHLRRIFNPRNEIRSRRRDDTCQHNCLIGNKTLRKIIGDETQARRERLMFYRNLKSK